MSERRISIWSCGIACSIVIFGAEPGQVHAALCTDTGDGASGSHAALQIARASEESTGLAFSGNVSWYGPYFDGRRTASGEIFDMRKLTAAHRHLPFFTKVLVENPKTGRSCIVKVNDRGPFVKSRVMDLSREGMHRVAPFMPGIIYADCLVLED